MDMPSVFNWNFDLCLPRYTGTALSEFWFNFIIMNIIYLYVKAKRNEDGLVLKTWWMVLFFCLFAFWDTDYFSFANYFYNIGLDDFRDPIYKYISYFSLGSYTLFRFWIWGGALYLVYKTAKRFKLNQNYFCYVFTIFFMLTFSYARVSLAMALYFYGLSFVIINDKRLSKRILIVLISFLLAYFAHRSILVPIILTPCAFVRLTRKKLIIFLSCLPIIVFAVKAVLGGIIASSLQDDSNEFLQAAQGYTNSNIEISFNWKWSLITTLRYWSFYLTIAVILYVIYIKENVSCSPEIRALLTVTLLIIVIAVTILVIAGNSMLGLWVVGYRYLYMAGIPLSLTLSYITERGGLTQKQTYLLLMIPLLYGELFIFGKILTMGFM